MLTFLGRGSGFSNVHNSAFLVDGKELFLIDCSMSSFQSILQIGKDGFSKDGDLEKIYIAVTHTHSDHISGIPLLIHYCFFFWNIPVVVGVPSEEVMKDMQYYLDRMDGCNKAAYELTYADKIKWIRHTVPVKHTPELDGRCFGYVIEHNNEIAIYTGDTSSLEPFKPYIEKADKLYTEVTLYDAPVHLNIHQNLEYLISLTKQGKEVYLMHLEDEEKLMEIIYSTSIMLAPLYNQGDNNMYNNSNQYLSDILNVSELLYRNMSSPDGRDHADIFNLLTTLGKILVNADRASFWKWDKASHTLWTTAATGTTTITIPETTGLVGKALQEGRVITTNDPYNDPDFNSDVDKQTGYVTKSILVMPVTNINGEFIGAYQVINKLDGDGKFHRAEDCRRLSLAAVICGLALESDVFLEESHTDKLTNLRNRMGFFNDFEKKYKKYITDPDKKLSLFICDIDKFKSVNDTYGHNTGDEVLKHVAGILSENCRACDGVYRWGGEEFIMIMTDTDMAACAEKAESIRKLVEANDCVTDEYTVHHTLSFGVSEFDTEKSIEANISVADEKLYTAKESGRNRVIS